MLSENNQFYRLGLNPMPKTGAFRRTNRLMHVRMKKYTTILVIILTMFSMAQQAHTASHGIWMWQHKTREWGYNAILRSATKQDSCITVLKEWGITQVFLRADLFESSLSTAIRNFNVKLMQAGIEPLYVATGDYLNHDKVVRETIQLATFNAASTESQRFVGIVLDWEPQVGDAEYASDSAQRTICYNRLLNEIIWFNQNIRNTETPDLPLSITLHPNVDNDTFINWLSDNYKQYWYEQLGNNCSSIMLMIYGKKQPESVVSAAQYEIAQCPDKIRVAVAVNGENFVYGSLAGFKNFLQLLKQNPALSGVSVDIHDFSSLMERIAAD